MEAQDQDVASPAQVLGVIEIEETQAEPKSDELLKYEKTLGGKKVYYRCGLVCSSDGTVMSNVVQKPVSRYCRVPGKRGLHQKPPPKHGQGTPIAL